MMRVTTTRTPTSFCPYCGHTFTAATDASLGDAVPKPGDFTLCIACAGVGVFRENLTVRRVSDQELRSLPKEMLRKLTVTRVALKGGFHS